MVVDLPLAAVKHLIDDENVAYVQRVWEGEPLDTWHGLGSPGGTSATTSKLRVKALETGDNLTWNSGTFTYDGSGNIKSIGNDQYIYDTAERLIQSTVNGSTEAYKYDSFGNLVEKTVAGATAGVVPVDPGSNRISGVAYDAIGDQTNDGTGGTAHYVYDGAGMLIAAVAKTSSVEQRMIYTADDERIGTQKDQDFVRWELRDFNTGQVLRGWVEGSGPYNPWQWQADFIYGEGKLVGGEREAYMGGRRHYSLDHLGNVRMITSDAKQRYGRHDYYPFGVEQTAWMQEYTNFQYLPPEPMRFAGHERDFPGL